MDGHFVNNLTFGPVVLKDIRKCTRLFLDCHLMVTEPSKWVEIFKKSGCDSFTFHIETDKVQETIDKVKKSGMKCGLALKPSTKWEDVCEFVKDLDLVLIMMVEPGFGGQAMMEGCLEKVKELRKLYPNLDIQGILLAY